MSNFSNISSRLVEGNLTFYSKTTGASLFTFDAENETITVEDGATLMIGDDTLEEYINSVTAS